MNRFFPAWLRIPILFFAGFGAIEYFVDSGDHPAVIKYPILLVVLLIYLFVLFAFETMMSSIHSLSWQMMDEAKRAEYLATQNLPLSQQPFYKKIMRWLTKSKSIEAEGEVMLNHDYDGIKELDNTLPPWWVYLFYGTIIFAAIYLVRFDVMGGYTQEDELRDELAVAKKEVEEWKKTAPDQMSEDKVTLLTDAESIAKGKTIFETNCVACHRADGGGQIGPNLTDEHWILGGGIKNVFHTITHGGRDGKGMIAWNTTLKPTQIQQVSSYVLSLQGTNPKEPKAAEGDIWKEAGAKTDTTATPAPATTETPAPAAKPIALK